ncbi:hypothetical protein AAFF_G00299330 [Aldrovandia affinis]|uniref:Uncharacterized protein n=1 Tax=Aldrovandia affinis TaxID=143900 RepID=A0AAD7W142_9TELE|nr:hypothetical protein AAFF_G00299330 [Aldrovandia affinis]
MWSNVTHVANASGKPIRVFYSPDSLTLEEIEVKFGTKASAEAKMSMKRDSRIRYIRIPANDFGKIVGEGAIYVTVFVENGADDDDDCLNISQNFHIPYNRSFIVTANHNIKFQKYGANIWVDEQGNRHGK